MDIYTGRVPRKFIRLLSAPAERSRTESVPTVTTQEGSGPPDLGSASAEDQSSSALPSTQTSTTSSEPTGSESSTSLEEYASAMVSKLLSQGVTMPLLWRISQVLSSPKKALPLCRLPLDL